MLEKFIENYCKVNNITDYILKTYKKEVFNSATGFNEVISLGQNEILFFKKAIFWSNTAFSQHNPFTIESSEGRDDLRYNSEIVFFETATNTTQKKYDLLLKAHKGNVSVVVTLPVGPFVLTGFCEFVILKNLTQQITKQC